MCTSIPNSHGQPDHSGNTNDAQATCMPDFSGQLRYLLAALYWFAFGFQVIPILPGKKRPAVKWDKWLQGLSVDQITEYWRRNRDHEVGFIVGEDIVVFDADSAPALEALKATEARLRIDPLLVVQTTRGEHHYYRLDPSLKGARIGRHLDATPAKLDIKTGRTVVVLPPSTGKTIKRLGGFHA